jgi:nicotinate phosphoribosyltransferase
VGRELRAAGRELVGIRLDSGDLAYLSIEARKLLDAAGFQRTAIVASNDLDEHIIASLKEQGATITVWGVGTKLATAYDEPALGGVYKMSAIRPRGAASWKYKVKLSEQAIKTSTPGLLQVRRYRDGDGPLSDMIYNEAEELPAAPTLIDPLDPTRRRVIPPATPCGDLLVPVFRGGKRVYDVPPIAEARARAKRELAEFHVGIKRFVNPHRYPVGLERGLHDLKTRLILEARGLAE